MNTPNESTGGEFQDQQPERLGASRRPDYEPAHPTVEAAVAGGILGAVAGVLFLMLIPGLGEVELLGGLLVGFVAGSLLFANGSILLRHQAHIHRPLGPGR